MKNYILIPIFIVSVVVSWYIWSQAPEYLRRGGPLLIIGLTLLFLAVTFALERAFVLWRAGGRGSVTGFVRTVRKAVDDGELPQAIEACKRQGGSLANVVGAGLERYQRLHGRDLEKKELIDETRRAIAESGSLESPLLERNLSALSTIASIATLLGLLGTTIGMIRAFHAMSRAGAPDATELAVGISEALVNTALGLTTAIIATVLYNYFATRVDNFTNQIEETSYDVLQLLEHHKEA